MRFASVFPGTVSRAPACTTEAAIVCTFVALLVVLASPMLYAQTPDETIPDSALPTGEEENFKTIVTSNRTGTTIIDSDRSVYAVSSEDVEANHSNDLLQALTAQPGAHAQRTNLGAVSPILRGQIGPSNLILIDGLRFNNSTFRTGPNQYLALIDPFALSGIEVLLGPGSVLYGSDALGGIVHGIPRVAPESLGVKGRAGTSLASADRSTSFVADFAGRDGHFSGWGGGRFRVHQPLRTGGGDLEPLSEYLQRDWRIRLGYDLPSGWEFRATYLGGQLENVGRADQAGKGDLRTYNNTDHFAYLESRYSGGALLKKARLALLYHQTEERVDRHTCRTNAENIVQDLAGCIGLTPLQVIRERRYMDRVNTVGGVLNGELRLFGNDLSILGGIEGYLDLVDSSLSTATPSTGFTFVEQSRGNFSSGSHYLQLGAFIYAEGVPFSGADSGDLVLSVGMRGTYANAYAPSVPGVGDVELEDFGVVTTAGIRYVFENTYAVYSNFSQGFRLPNLQESTVLGDTGSVFEVPNGNLGPETANTVEVGAKVSRSDISMSFGYFYSLVADLIVREPTTYDGGAVVEGKEVFHRVNAGEGRFHGFQSHVETGRFLGFSLAGTTTWTWGEVTRGDGSIEPARRVPPLFGRGAVRYHSADSELQFSVFVDWASSQTRLSPDDRKDLRICGDPLHPGLLQEECEVFPGYVSPGVSLVWRPHRDVTVFGEIENLLDNSYRTFGSGVDAPGINARIGTTVHF